MKLNKIYILISIIITLVVGCKEVPPAIIQSKKTLPIQIYLGCCESDSSLGLFDIPINSGEKDIEVMKKEYYSDSSNYMIFQKKYRFKDYSPFIEINSKDNRQERLWFSSTRWPLNEKQQIKLTDKIMQIYYTDRTIDGPLCPSQGWSENIRIFETGNEKFDILTKGSATIAGNKMILVADKYIENSKFRHEYKNLYVLERSDNRNTPFINPQEITQLSNDSTWETHPTLSSDGKHLFFVSNRYVQNYNKKYEYLNNKYINSAGATNNIYYSYFDGKEWSKPELVVAISTATNNQETPHISADGTTFYYASNKKGNYTIYQREIKLLDNGGYKIGNSEAETYVAGKKGEVWKNIETKYDERSCFEYHNPANPISDAIIWASNRNEGWGNYDIYGCGRQFTAELRVHFIDAESGTEIITEKPSASLFANDGTSVEEKNILPNQNYISFELEKGNSYFVKGGTTEEKDIKTNDSTKCSYWHKAKDKTDNTYLLDEKINTSYDTKFYKLNQLEQLKAKIADGIVSKENTSTCEYLGYNRMKKTITQTKYLDDLKIDTERNKIEVKIEQKLIERIYGYKKAIVGSAAEAEGNIINSPSILTEKSKNRNKELTIPDVLTENIVIEDTVYLAKNCNTIKVNYEVVLIDVCKKSPKEIIEPIISISGDIDKTIKNTSFKTTLPLNTEISVLGGSTAKLYDCAYNTKYTFLGYRKWDKNTSKCIYDNSGTRINGAEVFSKLSKISTYGIQKDTTIYDTIYITKNWFEKPACIGVSKVILGKHNNVAYFQTGFWEVNTQENLQRDLKKLEAGFSVSPTGIDRRLSDYDIKGNSSIVCGKKSMYNLDKSNTQKYSIANARWIELHPNNQYWGDRKDLCYSSLIPKRLKNREKRIGRHTNNFAKNYMEYAKKVDENIQIMTDMAIDFVEAAEEIESVSDGQVKPKILISIQAISDKRGVSRGWYIGENSIKYRRSELKRGRIDRTKPISDWFWTNKVEINPPVIDEANKVVSGITRGSGKIKTNDVFTGNNLGNDNIVLSRLRAWFGYMELKKVLLKDPLFKSYYDQNKVALPDNNISYNDAEIIVTTHGIQVPANKYISKMVGHSTKGDWGKYPKVNNPGDQGYFGYDLVRSINVDIRMLDFAKITITETSKCCNPLKKAQINKIDTIDITKPKNQIKKTEKTISQSDINIKKELSSLNKIIDAKVDYTFGYVVNFGVWYSTHKAEQFELRLKNIEGLNLDFDKISRNVNIKNDTFEKITLRYPTSSKEEAEKIIKILKNNGISGISIEKSK
jgi:hypothetical protein